MPKYTIDTTCCEAIDQYIKDAQFVVDKLVELHANFTSADKRSFSKILKEAGLGTAAIAHGGVSSATAAKAACYKEVVASIETDTGLNLGMAMQLVIIGGHGYWNPIKWVFAEKGYARSQWILTRFVIEIARNLYKLAKLKRVKAACKKAGM
ncbi:MAG: hypothetical protein ACI92Z_003272 [Paracoccaceae bacterium]|jgi:hypothetical protein